jgi:hypothetical protein
VIASYRFGERGTYYARIHPASGYPYDTEITLTSLGSRIIAPLGNNCARGPEGLGCHRVYFEGHPTRRRLPVAAGQLLTVRAPCSARSVFVRLLDGVAEGGGPTGGFGPELYAGRDPEGGLAGAPTKAFGSAGRRRGGCELRRRLRHPLRRGRPRGLRQLLRAHPARNRQAQR